MSELEILRWPDPRLSQRAATVGHITPEVQSLANDMLETMYAATGRGLAAPQVGRMLRLFVMDVTWKEGSRRPQVFVDPKVTACSDNTGMHAEGCLSIPGVTTDVTRPDWIDMTWTDLGRAQHHGRFEGFSAVCAQHEMDHLEGIVTFDRLSPDARAVAERTYSEAHV